jgi:5-methylcytosine-specific restriction endonuclease McrA
MKEAINKFTYEYVYNYFIEKECFLLESEYIDCFTKMKYRCKCGNQSIITFNNFKNNEQRCKQCSPLRSSETQRFDYEFVKNYIESVDGYKLISTTYQNTDTKLEIQCDKDHVYFAPFYRFKNQECRCPYCLYESKKGENNINWNPNKTDEERIITREVARNFPENKQWRKQVFERDNYTCQICDKRGGLLVPHHLYNYAQYPELRYDINNGVTLHKEEHDLFHKIYGKKNNTPDQFFEFKNNQIQLQQKVMVMDNG